MRWRWRRRLRSDTRPRTPPAVEDEGVEDVAGRGGTFKCDFRASRKIRHAGITKDIERLRETTCAFILPFFSNC
jgi:hypothetical protein